MNFCRELLTHSLTHSLLAGALLLAACAPGPATSLDALAQATTLAGQEQRATVQAAETTAQAAQMHAQETQTAIQATAAEATAGAYRATEISTRATSIAVEAAALERNAEASATAAVIAATIRALPTQAAATATRQAAIQRRTNRAIDAAGLLLAWGGLVFALWVGGILVERRARAVVEAVRLAREAQRLLPAGQAYDVSKQPAKPEEEQSHEPTANT